MVFESNSEALPLPETFESRVVLYTRRKWIAIGPMCASESNVFHFSI